MRFLIQAAALALLTAPALAQSTPPAAAPDSTTAPAAPAPAAPAPQTAAPPVASPAAPAAPKKYVGHKQTLKQRFAAANATHDGHLTKDQATAAKWGYVARHFAAIDSASKGYVTVDDIRAYAKAQRVAHPKPAAPTTPAGSNT